MTETPKRIWAYTRNDEGYWRREPCVGGIPYVPASIADGMHAALRVALDLLEVGGYGPGDGAHDTITAAMAKAEGEAE